MASERPTPDLPGVFGDFDEVESEDYGVLVETEDGALTSLEVDPSPLAHAVAAVLQMTDNNPTAMMRAAVEDDRVGPIHLVHLLAACEYAARQFGGGLPGPGEMPPRQTGFLAFSMSGNAVPALMGALREGGRPAAAELAQQMDRDLRVAVMDSLLNYLTLPIMGLVIDLPEHLFRDGESRRDQ